MRRILAVIAAGGAFLALAVPVALATNAHFVSASASFDGANLKVAFKEAGLGDNQLIDYRASADASATYVCVNGGGKNPSASNKTTVNGPVSKEGSFSSGKNGNVTASLTLEPPPAPSTFSCPPGQKGPVLAVVSYTNVTISDLTNGITVPIDGTFSKCVLDNVRGACD